MTDDNAQANPIDLGKLLVEDFPSALPALVNRVNLVDASFIEVGLAYARDAGNPRANRLAVLNACRHARLLGERKAEVTAAYDQLQAETDRLELEDAMARQDGPALMGLAGRLSTLKDLRENPLYQDIPPMLLDYFKRSLEQKYLALAAYTDQALSLLGEEGAPERQARLDAVRDELVAEKNRLLQARLDETLTRVRKKEQALEAVLFTENYLNALINRKRKSPSPTPGALVGEAEQTIQAFADRFYEIEDEPEYAQSLARLEAARRELVKAQEERNRHADALPVEKSAEGGGSKWAYLNFAVGLASLLGVLGIAYHLFVNQPIQNQKESNALVRTVSALIYGTPVVPTRTPVSTFTPYRTATTYRSITPYRSVTPAITSAPAALKWAFDYPAD
jgi:hypothetical protein